MFGVSYSPMTRLFDTPQRYHGGSEFRPPSPDSRCQSCPSHRRRSRSNPFLIAAAAGPTDAQQGEAADGPAVAPMCRHEAMLPNGRGPRPSVLGSRHSSLPRQQSPTGRTEVNRGGSDAQHAVPLSNVLVRGLHGFQTCMRIVMHSHKCGVLKERLMPYEASNSNATYRVPESPVPMMRGANREDTGRHGRRRRAQAQVPGIPIGEQHRLLQRLRFFCSSLNQETASVTSSPTSKCSSTSSSLSVLTPLSVSVPHGADPCTMQSWFVSLDAADPHRVPCSVMPHSCFVCLRRFQDEEDVAELPCAHLFHFSCIIRWLRRQGSCPCCRADVRKLYRQTKGATEDPPGAAAR
ncbi:hypothetical protein ABL78_7226 [Leptomonas seymouri]|uniref:RING-type domain-containing protein n=1 Tax=Leptomonas seymouri TaxID=5684 RepID=A0A0N1HSN5_LEPSE|nr:hypothetical protein ABL78_7226 [Leptomonas seymouri]|eukprot:KPI83723.1 hypothetical protein ABL78_7226 [Leptomonas seymouri]